ncbi:MAG: prepilin-type N-terminal cleavage/methylation domain-containing protein [Pirellulaceae bacterium]|nr:prepilin-type N-terminal cleavage/methylation domain-containing protein [Pirellulaceae bacterium]
MIGIISRKFPVKVGSFSTNRKINEATQLGFTLIELVLVLMILAILAGAAMSMVDTQVDQARFESTQQTLQMIDRGVLGPEYARAADGSRSVSGFVADCGRLPHSLEELYIRPASVPQFFIGKPDGVDESTNADNDVIVSGCWNGPYVQPAIGATSLPDGWASGFGVYDSDGDSYATEDFDALGVLRSLGRDQAVGGTNYDADLSLIFEADADAVTVGLATQVENRWQKSLTVYVYYNDSSTNPEVANGDKIVVRVYGPVADPTTGAVTLGTIQQEIVEYSSSTVPPAPFPVSVTFSDLPIGPRIIRAYQLLNASADPDPADELSDDSDLQAISVPTRLVVSRETSSIQLILRED